MGVTKPPYRRSYAYAFASDLSPDVVLTSQFKGVDHLDRRGFPFSEVFDQLLNMFVVN